jgi:hypothetical protein
MAAKKRGTKRKRRAPARGAGLGQKILVLLSGLVLVICAASVTSGFFLRRGGTGPAYSQFRLEVLNGTGIGGLAHAAKRGLLMRGIDVIAVRNADHFEHEESVLIARKKGVDVGRIGKIIGCENVVEQIRDDTLEDATLIVGHDYQRLHLDWKNGLDLVE